MKGQPIIKNASNHCDATKQDRVCMSSLSSSKCRLSDSLPGGSQRFAPTLLGFHPVNS
jgi:hypothetical protein